MSNRVILIGHPVGHSVSPNFQQAAYDHASLDLTYHSMDIDPIDLSTFLETMRSSNIVGANVTVPHKENVIPFIDEIHEDAKVIGAINTIANHNGHLVGYNTDASGFIKSLTEVAGFDPFDKSALILGAGGAAKAVAFALAKHGASRISVANRTYNRALSLVKGLETLYRFAEAVPLDDNVLKQIAKQSHIIINATTIGMHGGPEPDRSPLHRDYISSGSLVVDLVYNPAKTPLLKEASASGAATLGGLPMLVYQGAVCFNILTGLEAPIGVMYKAAESAMLKRNFESNG